jgi:hypothetical protein
MAYNLIRKAPRKLSNSDHKEEKWSEMFQAYTRLTVDHDWHLVVLAGDLLRHRQTKEAATDMFSLQPPRHIPTLPFGADLVCAQIVQRPKCPESGRKVRALASL